MIIDDYKVICSINQSELVRSVCIQVKKDWHLIGGIAVDNNIFYQAMIKYPELPRVKLPKY